MGATPGQRTDQPLKDSTISYLIRRLTSVRQLIAGITVIGILLVLMLVLVALNVAGFRRANRWSAHTYEVLVATQDVGGAVVNPPEHFVA
ncbi:MAG: hypothetical protein KY464_13840 [Gemmatimonadetes bacterium]|nr:hypothetical protein [Gemmatimonadota bacterium]